jgi:hypothetical protein
MLLKLVRRYGSRCKSRAAWSMIPKSGYRFSEKIMLNQEARARF